VTRNRDLEEKQHINFPVFEGEDSDDSNLETYEEVDFEDRRATRRDDEPAE
jgi:hypothetical protein